MRPAQPWEGRLRLVERLRWKGRLRWEARAVLGGTLALEFDSSDGGD